MNRRDFLKKTFGVMAGVSLLPKVATSHPLPAHAIAEYYNEYAVNPRYEIKKEYLLSERLKHIAKE